MNDETTRKPGKRVRRPEQTRQNILAAATIEFAAMGLTGARTASIAKRAGVNAQAIFHHFGSKDALYTAVVTSLFKDNWYVEQRDRLLRDDPRRAMGEIIDFMTGWARTEPAFMAILTDANMHSGGRLKGVPSIAAYYEELMVTLGAVLERGAGTGVFHPTDPVFFYAVLVGAIGSPYNTAALFSSPLKKDYRREAEISQWNADFKALMLRGVTRHDAPSAA